MATKLPMYSVEHAFPSRCNSTSFCAQETSRVTRSDSMLGYASEHMICRAYVGPHLHLMAKGIKRAGRERNDAPGKRRSAASSIHNRSWTVVNLNLGCGNEENLG